MLFNNFKYKQKSKLMNSEPEKSHQWPQIVAALSSLVLVTSAGLHAGWSSPALPKLKTYDMGFGVTEDEASYLVTIYPLGYLIATPSTSYLLDNIGRKYSVMFSAIPIMLAWFLISVADDIYALYTARVIAGFGEGTVFAMVPVYICEISEPVIRGRLGVGFTTALTFGFFLMNSYGSYMSIRAAASVSLLPPLIFLLIFMWMPESPYYYLMKGDTERARSSLQQLRRMNNVENEIVKLTADVQRQISESGTFKDLFTIESNLKALLILIGLRILQQISGGATIVFYIQTIFMEATTRISHSVSSIIFTGSLSLVSSTCLFLVDRYGRRPLMLLSVGCTILCLLVEAIYFTLKYHKYDTTHISWVPITGMVFYTIVRGFGLVSIPTLLTGELFSASVKAKGMGIFNLCTALSISSTAWLFQQLNKHFGGMHAPFIFFTIGAAVGLVFVYYCVPETKDKTLEEIQQQLKGNIT